MERLALQSEDEINAEIERLQDLSMEMEHISKWKLDKILQTDQS
jgi:ribosomal 50S subunit-associated protein YjgA (DUF615 family)